MADRWRLTDHCCRVCFGRVLRHEDGHRLRCAECGAEGEGPVESMCFCGVEVCGEQPFQCLPNPERGADTPNEVCVVERDLPADDPRAR